MKDLIQKALDIISKAVPVEWDRFTVSDDNQFWVVYGWIARSDGQRDFVMIEVWEGIPIEDIFFTTSSAKYSKQIMEALSGTSEGHNDCRKITELHA